jgi:hypothetical protein
MPNTGLSMDAYQTQHTEEVQQYGYNNNYDNQQAYDYSGQHQSQSSNNQHYEGAHQYSNQGNEVDPYNYGGAQDYSQPN